MTKSKLLYIIFFVICLFSMNLFVYADYDVQVVKTTPCQLYYDLKGKTATGSCMYKDNTFKSYVSGPIWVDIGDKLKVITSKAPIKAPVTGYGSECKTEFLNVSIDYASKVYTGYVCKDTLWDGKISDELKNEFKEAGFPESYYSSLALLKTAHPNWKFVAINTELDFYTAVDNEDRGNKSLIQYTSSTNDLGYLSTDEGNYNWLTDKYTVYDGSSWYAANRDTIAYYLDPRNFLSDNYIFQFETIAYEESEYNLKIVQSLLKGQYLSNYSEIFVNSGKSANVSPVYLAALSKQEVGGSSTSTAISGAQFTYEGKTYSNLYNFYNIGATSGSTPVYRGLVYANGGADGKTITYNRPWNTPEKAILGGAQFIYENYLKSGQNTSYFKKWNVVYNYAIKNGLSPSKNYTHQYMQNIQAPRSEAYSTYKSYSSLELLDMGFVFYIPVYKNMPATTVLPKRGSPNNYLKTLTITKGDNTKVNVEGFSGDKVDYEIHVDSNTEKITLAGTTVRSDASISGIGTKVLVEGENKYVLSVKANNGDVRNYNIKVVKAKKEGTIIKDADTIIKESNLNIDGEYITGLTLTTDVSYIKNIIYKIESSANVTIKRNNSDVASGNLKTGDVITISSGDKKVVYTIVIYGDTNGDSNINVLDLLRVQKNILGSSKLTNANLKSADVSKDGKVTVLDLLKVQKHILGDSLISQK